MAVTANGTPTDAWTLITSASGNATVSISCDTYDLQVANHSSGSTPPAATLKGHRVKAGDVMVVSMVNGDHIWHRIHPLKDVGTPDDAAKTVYTVQT